MPRSSTAAEPSASQVRAQCDRILASSAFNHSKRQSAFLGYVVDAQLSGSPERLKEYSIGVDVFDRGENFDPGVESIVRVEASRLRAKLREYYAGDGLDAAVHIDIPKGHYVPVFTHTKFSSDDSKRPNQHLLLAAAMAMVVAVILAVVYNANQTPSYIANPGADLAPIPAPTSVAVLPLRDFSSEPEEYFSSALTDALISALAGNRALRVTSLTSVMAYKNTDVAIREIGYALGVAYLVEGSVVRDAGDVRITAQLIDAKNDTHVWSETFERKASDLLHLQGEVSAAIAGRISGELLPATESARPSWNPAAHEAYMKGRYHYNQFTSESFRKSIRLFQKAIDIEPEYAAAYAGLASCHCLLAGHGLELVAPDVALPEARSLANKAMSLDSGLAEPYAFLGIVKFKYEWDPEAAEELFAEAIERNPSMHQVYVWQSQVMEALGRHEDAISRARHARLLDPLSLAASLNLGWQMYQAGYYTEAEAEVDKLIEFDPDFWGGHWAKGHIHIQRGSHDHAIRALGKAVELGGGHSLPLSSLGYAYAAAGMPAEARRIIAQLGALSKNVYVSPFHIATIYAGLNEPDLMFEWLERAYTARARSLAWLRVSRELQPYQNDDRFQDLLHRIGIRSRPAPN